MPVASLSRVELLAPEGELGVLLGLLTETAEFHPSKREGLVQDTGLLLIGSRAHSVAYDAGELLQKSAAPSTDGRPVVCDFKAQSLAQLVSGLGESLNDLRDKLAQSQEGPERHELLNRVRGIREAATTVFNDLQRIRVYPGLRRSAVLEGYVPTKSLEAFTKMARKYLIAAEPVDKRRPNDPYVPTLLVNSRLATLFESLTLEQGVPKYNEIDPTPIVAFVFPLFFGIMFGDLGHGLLLVGFGWFLAKRTKYANWGQLIIVFGASASIIGLARGLFFGIGFSSPLSGIIPLPNALKGGFQITYVPFLLETAIIVGSFHLATAYLIAFLNQVRSRNYADAFLGHLPTLVLYSSLVPLALAVAGNGLMVSNLFHSTKNTPVLAEFYGLDVPVSVTAMVSLPLVIASLSVLVIGHPVRAYLSTHNLRKTLLALGSGLLESVTRPFEFFVNTISYIRLGVLFIICSISTGLATSAISLGLPGILLAAFLNLLVMGMEGFIVYVQDLRLQIYEWFTKFYSGLGEPFRPLVSGGDYSRISWV